MQAIRTQLLHSLREKPSLGYAANQADAAEPLALAALAAHAEGDSDAADRWTEKLSDFQDRQGRVGVRRGDAPYWPTALALLLWNARDSHRTHVKRAITWLLAVKGTPIETEEDIVGHDTNLIAWPWVIGTHSWVEPTALATAALKSSGLADHPRTREAVRLLRDRLLPSGGCNYGNTMVLQQELRPHPMPTGMALWALAGEKRCRKTQLSIDYLREVVGDCDTPWSFAWAVLGLAAWQVAPPQQHRFEEVAATADQLGDPLSLALMLHALQGHRSWLLRHLRSHQPTLSNEIPSHV